MANWKLATLSNIVGVDSPGARCWSTRIIVLVWLLTLTLNAPGQLSYDSLVQLKEGRHFVFEGQHPPIMSLLLGIFDRIVPETGLYLLFVQGFFFGSLLLLVSRASRVTMLTVIALLVMAASPIVLIYQGIVWKDVLFANLALFAFVLLWNAHGYQRRTRFLHYLAALVAAAAGAQARQNGFVIMPILGIAIVYLETSGRTRWKDWTIKIAAGFLLGAGAFGTVTLTSNAIVRAVATAPPGNALATGTRWLVGYDIAGLASHDETDLSALAKRGLDVVVIRAEAQKYYSPQRIEFLGLALNLGRELAGVRTIDLVRAWLRLIVDNPLIYVRTRLAVFQWLTWPPEIRKCLPVHVGIDGPIELMKELTLHPGQTLRHHALYRYSALFFDTIVFRHGTYLIIALVIVGLLLAKGPPDGVPLLALAAAASVFALSFFLVGINCDFRFDYFLACAASVAVVALTTLDWSHQRPSGALP